MSHPFLPSFRLAFVAVLGSLALVAASSLAGEEPKSSTPAAKAAAGNKINAKPADKAAAKKKAPARAGETKKSDVANAVASSPRKIVLIAGPKDEKHGPGTHEYEATARTIEESLKASNVAGLVRVETHLNGWPENPATLDDADTIFLVSAGSDHKEEHHPFLVGDRMKILEKQMDRGCGLALLHWSVFVPIKYEKQFSEWVGGFFDYQRGDDPRGWFSAITFAKAEIHPNQKHPIGKGVSPFEHRDEYYYNIRFRPKDKRITPIVTVKLPEVEKPQVVAWTVERKDGGRGFAFTGGHFQKSWENEAYRTLLLNAVCWTAKVPVPTGGVHKELSFDDQWTPKPHLGKDDLPKEKESDWVDGRIRESDVGPYYTASITMPEAGQSVASAPKDDRKEPPSERMIVKALAIQVGGQEGVPPATVLFDKERMSLRCGWTGKFLNFSDRRFGLLEKPTIGGEITFRSTSDTWETGEGKTAKPVAASGRDWRGMYRRGDRLVLDYSIADRDIRELNGSEAAEGSWAFARTLEVGPGTTPLTLTIARLPDAAPKQVEPSRPSIAVLETENGALFAAAIGSADGAVVTARDDRLLLTFPARETASQVKVLLRSGTSDDLAGFTALAAGSSPAIDLAPLTKAGLRQWGEPLITKGTLGTPQEGSPFAVDTITIPKENPFKALFFAGGFDFAPDGTCYLCTAHGDVWKVTGINEGLEEIRWQRFATGLYEPLGVKVRDGEVFVLGRDQISRLHDTNGDGEADFYENFNDDLTDHGQSHAYAMCLETDAEGNFYFVKSGAPATPHGGTLLKVSADGKTLEVYATGFRHTNGLGVGPDGTITTADNEGNWIPVTRVDIIEKGEFCGHVPTAHLDVEPTDPGQPLCWLPRVVDNSAGGQAWVPKGSWGPLSESLLHLSYGQCTASVILKERVDGVWQGGAVKLPTEQFLSGVCRGRFRTAGAGADGHLYVCGLNGWSSAAADDGCLQRVRYVGGPVPLPTGLHVHENGLELTFAEPLDPKLAGDPKRYAVNIWNYRWTKDYGSADYSVAEPTKQGRDKLAVTGATLSEDGRRVFVTVEGLQPVMQLRVQAGLKTAAGAKLPVNYYGTVHRLRAASQPTAAPAVTNSSGG